MTAKERVAKGWHVVPMDEMGQIYIFSDGLTVSLRGPEPSGLVPIMNAHRAARLAAVLVELFPEECKLAGVVESRRDRAPKQEHHL